LELLLPLLDDKGLLLLTAGEGFLVLPLDGEELALLLGSKGEPRSGLSKGGGGGGGGGSREAGRCGGDGLEPRSVVRVGSYPLLPTALG
jgi:hypothetical protein